MTHPYELMLEPRPGYLYARIKADTITDKVAMRYLRKVTARCRALKCDRLLLHRDIPSMLPTGSLFFLASEFQQRVRGIRVAFVNPYPSNEPDLTFGVTVGTNRGADYAVFDNDADAEAWLLNGVRT